LHEEPYQSRSDPHNRRSRSAPLLLPESPLTPMPDRHTEPDPVRCWIPRDRSSTLPRACFEEP
jgi:hypothetical protein